MRISRPTLVWGVLASLFVLIFLAFFVLQERSTEHAVAAFKEDIVRDTSFQSQWAAYTHLLKTVGSALAQDTLQSSMPANPRTHTLNHASGKYLYQEEGLEGIYDCKNYFNGSCFHGFISDVLSDRGVGALAEIIQLCQAGRPLEQARECSHGVGHGFLILSGYAHLPEAVAKCRTAFASSSQAIADCNDGVFMENNFGEFNTPPDDRWYKASDPLYPCDAKEISGDIIARDSCWFMQSQATLNATMYPRFEGSVQKVAAYCTTLPEAGDKRMCTKGLARQIQANAGNNTDSMTSKCQEAFPTNPTLCYSDAAESAYSFGAESAGLQLCALSGAHIAECYQAISKRIASTSYRTLRDRLAACARIPNTLYSSKCTEYIRTNTNGGN